MIFRPILALVAVAATLAAGLAPVRAEQTVTTRYGVSIIGLPVGKASFDTTIDGSRFSVKGTLSSAGLGSLVSNTRGTSRVAGKVTSRGFAAESYGLDYTSDAKRWSSDVAFSGGRVTCESNVPGALARSWWRKRNGRWSSGSSGVTSENRISSKREMGDQWMRGPVDAWMSDE